MKSFWLLFLGACCVLVCEAAEDYDFEMKDIHIPIDLSPIVMSEYNSGKKKQELGKILIASLLEQISFDEDGAVYPGQRMCIPLVTREDTVIDRVSNPDMEETFAPTLYLIRSARDMLNGNFLLNMVQKFTNPVVPEPTHHFLVNYSHENHEYVDLGNDVDLGSGSFTISAVIRLRESGHPFKVNRGSRILSMRDSNDAGWEFVAPSYTGKKLSFYAAATKDGEVSKFPGHIDYGRATLAGNRWTVVTLTFDRDTYEGSIARCTSYIDGLSDGTGQLVEIEGSLSTKANLTVGHKRDEYNNLALGRRDFKLPGFPRFNPHFQGDIREVFIWYEALNQFQVKKHAKEHGKTATAERSRSSSGGKMCPPGYKELDCVCYRVYDEPRAFNAAQQRCREQGGTLAMPKTEKIQDFLELLMQQSREYSFWIGLEDRVKERTHVWSDGTIINLHKRVGKPADFNKFPNGKPDKEYNTEDCVEQLKTRPKFIWNDENCVKLNSFICEKPSEAPNCTKS